MPDSHPPRKLFTHPIHLLAFGLGSGLPNRAPGTFGTVAAMLLYYLIAPFLSLPVYVAACLITTVFACYAAHVTARDLGVHDHKGIVIDEWVGYWITMIAVPINWYYPLIGFLLFRLFDIWKPWPIGWLDKNIPGGIGIVVDDIAAGIFAGILMQIIVYWMGG